MPNIRFNKSDAIINLSYVLLTINFMAGMFSVIIGSENSSEVVRQDTNSQSVFNTTLADVQNRLRDVSDIFAVEVAPQAVAAVPHAVTQSGLVVSNTGSIQ